MRNFNFELVSVAEENGLSHALSETPKTGFLAMIISNTVMRQYQSKVIRQCQFVSALSSAVLFLEVPIENGVDPDQTDPDQSLDQS